MSQPAFAPIVEPYKAFRTFQRQDQTVTFYVRDVAGVFEIHMDTAPESIAVHKFSGTDEVAQFLDETALTYIKDGWTELEHFDMPAVR